MKFGRSVPILIALVCALYLAFFAARLNRYAGHGSAFVGFGCYTTEVCWARDNRSLLPDDSVVFRTGGYDGQFYYYIAAGLGRGIIPALDAPALRRSRIGYSLLVAPAIWFGPNVLIVALLALPFVVHLLVLFSLFGFFRAHVVGSGEAAARSWLPAFAGLVLFALNPFSLYANGLALADGLALGLGTFALLYFWRTLGARGRDAMHPMVVFRLYLPAFVAAVWACLTKETMLALPLGVGTAALLRRDWRSCGFWFAVPLPVFFYWYWIGFSPGMAADRGGLPFAGYVEFLSGASGLSGGRGLLALLLPAYIAVGLGLAWRSYKVPFVPERPDPLSLAGVLAVSTALISFATADEYWANFANISRFFIPGLLPLVLLPALFTGDADSAARDRWRAVSIGLAGFMILFSLSLLYAELRAAPLPYDIWPRIDAD